MVETSTPSGDGGEDPGTMDLLAWAGRLSAWEVTLSCGAENTRRVQVPSAGH